MENVSKFRTSLSVNQMIEKGFSMEYIREKLGYDFKVKDRKGQINYNDPISIILVTGRRVIKNHQIPNDIFLWFLLYNTMLTNSIPIKTPYDMILPTAKKFSGYEKTYPADRLTGKKTRVTYWKMIYGRKIILWNKFGFLSEIL